MHTTAGLESKRESKAEAQMIQINKIHSKHKSTNKNDNTTYQSLSEYL